ncbi:MAG: hypothetical protein K6F39_04385 [Lachnospiraceae bacterium]|nr:hypothetical protein [Lachnospiraceae bacterium]
MKNNTFKSIIACTVATSMLLTACGSSSSANIASETASTAEVTTAAPEATAESAVSTEDASAESETASTESAYLPEFVYEGDDEIISASCKFILDELAKGYLDGAALIPCPIIIAVDDSNADDILCYGLFDLYTYDLNGDTLETVAGGENPGCIHLKKNSSGEFEVTDFDCVEDGSSYTESAKKIFGEHYDKFEETVSDSKSKEEIRKSFIKDYVVANELPATKYQDYGWDPIDIF